jgi:hypothetical protein
MQGVFAPGGETEECSLKLQILGRGATGNNLIRKEDHGPTN